MIDKMVNGIIQFGYDNELGVEVKDFIIQPCKHTDFYRAEHGNYCCNGFIYRNHDIRIVKRKGVRVNEISTEHKQHNFNLTK